MEIAPLTTKAQIDKLLKPSPSPYAVDLETTDYVPAGMGFANDEHCWYWNVVDLDPELKAYLVERMQSLTFVAHNVMFDATRLKEWTGHWLKFVTCTFALYKQIACEGHIGQRWGLKHAEVDVLGWPESNEGPLHDYMDEHDIPDAKMGTVPTHILGPYCAADADACWSLYQVLTAAAKPFPFLQVYHTKFLELIQLCGDQFHRGILVDKDKLAVYLDSLEKNIVGKMGEFMEHGEVAPYRSAYRELTWTRHTEAHPKSRVLRDDPKFDFNPNSKPQLGWLLYDCLGYTPPKMTEGGRRSVDKKVLPMFGEPGKLLNSYNKLTKEAGYVRTALAKLDHANVLHPEFKTPGTLTGRLAGGGGMNLQQQPKTQGYLECFRARPGHVLVQLDFSAVEPVVLAEHSADAALMTIYGPGNPPNDIYLFTASQIDGLNHDIRKYYDPANPTKEGIAAAKKHCKKWRDIAKTVQLAKTYNAGAKNIHETLVLGGVDISLAEVRKICDQFDELYSGVTKFKYTLEREWKNRNGYILNGLGRPIAVSPMLTKDLTNRFCQSTGHDLLVLFIANINRLRLETDTGMHPWLADFHDESIWEVREDHADRAAALMTQALGELNEYIQPVIPIKGDPVICQTLADIKIEAA